MPALATLELGLPADGGGGPQLPWSFTRIPLPHPVRHPQGQQPWPPLPVSYFQLLPMQGGFRSQCRK